MSDTSSARDAYITVTSLMFVIIVATHVVFLVKTPDSDKLNPKRWAGLCSWVVWWPWLVCALAMAAAYVVFVVLFVLNSEQERDNGMYHVVCIFSLLLCVSAATWPYLVRVEELGGVYFPPGSGLGGVRIIEFLLCPCVCFACGKLGKKHVVANLLFSFVFSLIMLILFWVGAPEKGITGDSETVFYALVYMVFYLGVLDLALWGYTWYNDLVSDYKKEEGVRFISFNEVYGQLASGSEGHALVGDNLKVTKSVGASLLGSVRMQFPRKFQLVGQPLLKNVEGI